MAGRSHQCPTARSRPPATRVSSARKMAAESRTPRSARISSTSAVRYSGQIQSAAETVPQPIPASRRRSWCRSCRWLSGIEYEIRHQRSERVHLRALCRSAGRRAPGPEWRLARGRNRPCHPAPQDRADPCHAPEVRPSGYASGSTPTVAISSVKAATAIQPPHATQIAADDGAKQRGRAAGARVRIIREARDPRRRRAD